MYSIHIRAKRCPKLKIRKESKINKRQDKKYNKKVAGQFMFVLCDRLRHRHIEIQDWSCSLQLEET